MNITCCHSFPILFAEKLFPGHIYVIGTVYRNKRQHFLRKLLGFFFFQVFCSHWGLSISRVLRAVYHTGCCFLVLLQAGYYSSASWAANSAQHISPFLHSVTTTLLQQDEQAPSHSVDTAGQHAILQHSFGQ